MELHSKALRYIRQHTKRCMACGEIPFTRLLGKIVQETRKTKLIIDLDIPQFEKATYILKEELEDGIYLESISSLDMN